MREARYFALPSAGRPLPLPDSKGRRVLPHKIPQTHTACEPVGIKIILAGQFKKTRYSKYQWKTSDEAKNKRNNWNNQGKQKENKYKNEKHAIAF